MWHVAAAAAAAVGRTHTQHLQAEKKEERELTLSSRCKCLEINLCRLQRCHKKTLINVYTLPGVPQ